jgi:hypothetical protein
MRCAGIFGSCVKIRCAVCEILEALERSSQISFRLTMQPRHANCVLQGVRGGSARYPPNRRSKLMRIKNPSTVTAMNARTRKIKSLVTRASIVSSYPSGMRLRRQYRKCGQHCTNRFTRGTQCRVPRQRLREIVVMVTAMLMVWVSVMLSPHRFAPRHTGLLLAGDLTGLGRDAAPPLSAQHRDGTISEGQPLRHDGHEVC